MPRPGSPSLAAIDLVARAWNSLGTPLRRALAWLTNPKFIHGVSGIILDSDGRVLLLKHRFWKGQPWGLPGGMANHGESPAETLRRELVEEVALEIRPIKLLRVSTVKPRVTEFTLLAETTGTPRIASSEIMEAAFFDATALPENVLQTHRELLGNLQALITAPGLPIEN